MINTDRLCLGCMNDNGGEKFCPVCGFDAQSSNPENALPLKFKINNRYLLGRVLGSNGEGITYIGWDTLEDAVVKVREYFPQGFAERNPDKTVKIVEGSEYTFNEGLLDFLQINRTIMRSDLPSLMPIIEVFEENGSIYSVAKNISGITLSEFLDKNGGTLKWEQVRALFLPLLDTLIGMNNIGIIHGGISPDTIIVGRDGKLRISGYCVIKLRNSQSELDSELFSGYAAAEQYGLEGVSLGKYTDTYGLAATLFRVLIGTVPPSASQRLENDSMTISSKFAEELPRHVLSALANGLQVLPNNRTKDIEAFKNELVYGEVEKATVAVNNVTNANEAPKKSSSGKVAFLAAIITAVVFLGIGAALIFGVFKDQIFKKEDPSANKQPAVVEPDVDKIGDVDADAEVKPKHYVVPDFKGKFYADICNNEDYENFKFEIASTEFSDSIPVGAVVSQDVKNGTQVKKGTVIKLTISSGSKTVKMPSLQGLKPEEAILTLLKNGFLYSNIEIDKESMLDEDKKLGVTINQEPKAGTTVSRFENVKVYINGEEVENPENDADN